MRFLSACLLSTLLVFFSFSFVFAKYDYNFSNFSEGDVNEALQRIVPYRLLPSHPLYFLIRAKETFDRQLNLSDAKRAVFDLILSGKRLNEAYDLFETNDIKNANKSLKRY